MFVPSTAHPSISVIYDSYRILGGSVLPDVDRCSGFSWLRNPYPYPFFLNKDDECGWVPIQIMGQSGQGQSFGKRRRELSLTWIDSVHEFRTLICKFGVWLRRICNNHHSYDIENEPLYRPKTHHRQPLGVSPTKHMAFGHIVTNIFGNEKNMPCQRIRQLSISQMNLAR